MSVIDKVSVGGTTYDLADSKVRASIAPAETATATAAHAVGEMITVDGVLYRVRKPIAIGDAIATSGSGANVKVDTVIGETDRIETLACGDFGLTAYGVDRGETDRGVTLTKGVNVLTVNGTRSQYTGLVNVSNAIAESFHIKTSSLTSLRLDYYTNQNAVFRAGHTYRVTAVFLSGTVTDGTTTGQYIGWFHGTIAEDNATFEKLSEDVAADIAAGIRTWHQEFTAVAETYVGYGILMRPGSVWNNVKIRYIFEEILPDDTTVTVSGDSPTITAVADRRYVCEDTVSEISFTPCATGMCEVVFTTGSNPVWDSTTGAIMPQWWPSENPLQAGYTYEMSFRDGYGVVMAWPTT